MARRKTGSSDQGSLWSLSYEPASGAEDVGGASNLTLEKPDEQPRDGGDGNRRADDRPEISESAGQGRISPVEVSPQGIGNLRFDWGAAADAPASDQRMLGAAVNLPEVGDVADGGARSGLPEDPGPKRDELNPVLRSVFQAREGAIFFSSRAAAFQDVSSSGEQPEHMISATVRLRNVRVMPASAVVGLAKNPAAVDELKLSGFDGAADEEQSVLFAGSSAEISALDAKPVLNERNYRIPDAKAAVIGMATDKAKINANLAAVGLLKTIEREGRNPTADEQAQLASYVDFGGWR